MKIINDTYKYKYFNSNSLQLYEDIWDILTLNNLSSSSLVNHLYNSAHYVAKPNIYKPVIKDIYPIPPKSKWEFIENQFVNKDNLEIKLNKNREFSEIIKKLIKTLKNYKIGVELSGGLDSSVIIGVLKHFKINPFLIGFKCDRYEFRTERIIQDFYVSNSSNSFLIDSKSVLPFSGLKMTPKHQLPNPSSLYHNLKLCIAKKCYLNKIEILFNGMAGDPFFSDNVDGNKLPFNWQKWMLDNNWHNEYVFSKFKIIYTPTSNRQIAEFIFNHRINAGPDNSKKWARSYFSKYLPKELVKFQYKADHIGDLIEGIEESYADVLHIYSVAYEITKNKEFEKNQLDKLYDGIQKYDDRQIKNIIANISYANWLNSIVK
jgi:hypothetical protein